METPVHRTMEAPASSNMCDTQQQQYLPLEGVMLRGVLVVLIGVHTCILVNA